MLHFASDVLNTSFCEHLLTTIFLMSSDILAWCNDKYFLVECAVPKRSQKYLYSPTEVIGISWRAGSLKAKHIKKCIDQA